ncbi:MAG TPA: formyltetrahydrofolate deformylase [Candidatus Limnocylindria bacterium]|nr:formyltetrahydrofolate deformylase [Candidatus Limnocylindria bacterium]
MPNAVLLAHGPLRPRLAAALTDFVYRSGGRIVSHEQYVDQEDARYYTRLEWETEAPRERIEADLRAGIGEPFDLRWTLRSSDHRPRIGVFVSKLPHCLYEILARVRSGEWRAEVPLIVGNHPDLEPVARTFGIEFLLTPVDGSNKRAQEERQVAALRERGVELVVLARYMQVLSDGFVAAYPDAIVNIHHAFLPSFPGAKPYHAARRRGVKMIGATSHYVTAELDAGPIIEQDVIRVGHRHSVEELVRLGRDLEKIVLARAVRLHLERRVVVHDGRTVVFD